jgi:hypothetical protein
MDRPSADREAAQVTIAMRRTATLARKRAAAVARMPAIQTTAHGPGSL